MDIYDSCACIGYTWRKLTSHREYTVARLRAIVTNTIIHPRRYSLSKEVCMRSANFLLDSYFTSADELGILSQYWFAFGKLF